MEYLDIRNLEPIRISGEEAETTITTGRLDDHLMIFCSDNAMLTKITKAALKNIDKWKCWESGRDKSGNVCGYFFIAPKKALSIRSGNKKEVSEEYKEAMRVRLAQVKGRGRKKRQIGV